MRGERRDGVVQSSRVANPHPGMSGVTSTKPYVIAKRAVWEAYQQVKANRGTAGVDEETIAILMNLFMHYAFDVWMKRCGPQKFRPIPQGQAGNVSKRAILGDPCRVR